MIARSATLAAVMMTVMAFASTAHAYQLAISQYGRVTATLPWAVALEKGYFDDAGIKIDQVIAGAGGGTTLRNVLASDLPYGEVGDVGGDRGTAARDLMSSSSIQRAVISARLHWSPIRNRISAPSPTLPARKPATRRRNPPAMSCCIWRLKEAQYGGKVETVATGGFGPGITALETGAIQAAPLIDPTLTLEPEKFHVILQFADLIPRMTWLVGITTREFAQKNPELLRKLIAVRCAQRGIHLCRTVTRRCASTPRSGSRTQSRSRPISRNISATKANGPGAISRNPGSPKCRRACSSSAMSTAGRLECHHRPGIPAQRLA